MNETTLEKITHLGISDVYRSVLQRTERLYYTLRNRGAEQYRDPDVSDLGAIALCCLGPAQLGHGRKRYLDIAGTSGPWG
jgi:hypothetical protein